MKKRSDDTAESVTPAVAVAHGEKWNGTHAQEAALDLSAILASLQAMKEGDFSVRLPGSWTGLPGKIADTFNDIVAANEQMAQELKRVGNAVGKEGRTRERTRFREPKGAWGGMETSVNTLVDDLLRPTTEVIRAIGAVAQGNLSETIRLDVDGRPLEGEFLRSANIVNTMIQQLGVFTSEVTRVAREVGTEGKLGGQANVPGVAGTWKDLTDNCEPHGQQSDGAGAQYCRGWQRRWPAAIFRARSRLTCAVKFFSSKKPSIRWWISCAPSLQR